MYFQFTKVQSDTGDLKEIQAACACRTIYQKLSSVLRFQRDHNVRIQIKETFENLIQKMIMSVIT